MQLSLEEFEGLINKKLKTNQLLLFASVIIALTFAFVLKQNLIWSFYFLIIGALSLPNIQKCKTDRKLFRENSFDSISGTILDVFLEKEGGTNWIIFLEDESGKVHEHLITSKPHVQSQEQATLFITPKMNIVVRVSSKDEQKSMAG